MSDTFVCFAIVLVVFLLLLLLVWLEDLRQRRRHEESDQFRLDATRRRRRWLDNLSGVAKELTGAPVSQAPSRLPVKNWYLVRSGPQKDLPPMIFTVVGDTIVDCEPFSADMIHKRWSDFQVFCLRRGAVISKLPQKQAG